MITTIPTAYTISVLAETATETTDRITTGEWVVTISTVALTVVTVGAVLVTYLLYKVSRDLVRETHQANEVAVREMGNVAVNANDDMADVAKTAISHSAPVRAHHHHEPVRMVRKYDRKA